jgi:hypothetical protein
MLDAKSLAIDFAAPFRACDHLWHTELLPSGSTSVLGGERMDTPLEIDKNRKRLPARNSVRRQAD